MLHAIILRLTCPGLVKPVPTNHGPFFNSVRDRNGSSAWSPEVSLEAFVRGLNHTSGGGHKKQHAAL